MDQQPKIPTLKDAQKPQVKIKGMGAGLTLFDRLKQFKKKDLAFILAGLGTLFMAPLAEHFMMAPENGDASLQQGWGKGGSGGGNFFGSGSSPYESGNSLASGGAIGGSGDIITPLNVRDPSSLVMGPGGTQQPPAGSAAPAAPPPTAPASNETDYRDALKGAATRAASAAVKKAPLPVPKVALGGSGLRGLGVAGGGSSASGGSLPVGPAAGSLGGPGGGGMRLVRATPGFKGVAGGRSPTGGTGLDNTKKAGANAGDAFNRAGSAAAGLNAAASETIPTGGQGFGGGGQGGSGANDKPGSGTGPGGSKSVGESLAFLRAKQRQEEELKLEFEKRKLKDPELLLYGIRNDSLKLLAGDITKSLSKHITGFLDPSAAGSDANATISCTGGFQGLLSAAPMCGEKPTASGCVQKITTGGAPSYTWIVGTAQGTPCRVEGGKSTTAAAGAEVSPSSPGGALASDGALASGAPTVGAGLDGGCTGLTGLAKPPVVAGAVAASVDDKEIPHYTEMQGRAKNLGIARSLLNGEGSASACGARNPGTEDKTAVTLQRESLQKLQAAIPGMNGLIVKAADGAEGITTSQTTVSAAAKLVETARQQIDAAKGLLDNAGDFASYDKNKTAASEKSTKALTDGKAELLKQHGLIDGTQKTLEAALQKAKDTVGTTEAPAEATLVKVTAQNQAFLDMQAAVNRKKGEFAAAAKDETEKANWPKATVAEPKPVTAGGSAEPSVVTKAAETDETSAKKTIEAVCTKIGGCAAPAADAPAPAPTATAAEPPKYDEVSALFKPATDGVSTMRQVQSNAISGLSSDLNRMRPAQ